MEMEKILNGINAFLKSDKKSIEFRFRFGYYIKLKKHISEKGQTLEIHTAGYDGEMEVSEALEWLYWEVADCDANGILKDKMVTEESYMERIQKINDYLATVGSKFRTDDGENLVAFIRANHREIKFLRRSFQSIEDMEDFVFTVKG